MGESMKVVYAFLFLILAYPSVPAGAQTKDDSSMPGTQMGDMQQMPGMDQSESQKDQSKTGNAMRMQPTTLLQEIASHTSSGTSIEPNSTPVPMLMAMKGRWTLMFHANAFISDVQQSGPRGTDKFFSANWFMPMAQRTWGPGIFTVRTMLSLEPATVTGERYPLLFQQGETAYGRPIADGQHPHNLFMEIAAIYDWKISEHALVSFYAAPAGDPAIGPTAYPHRASAMEDPIATLGHHQEDSTHISDDVVTGGLAYRSFRIEASGFHGREPGEFRWGISQGGMDSWSMRATVQPGTNWSGQYSYGQITSPESLFPREDQARMTASAAYNRPLTNGNWASTFVWGRTRSLQDDSVFDSYLFESLIRFRQKNYAWTRIESAERSNELIIGENPLPPGFEEQSVGHVQAYTAGYDRDIGLFPHVASAMGAQFTGYITPARLQATYGAHPVGVVFFVRFRPFSEEQ
jgi:hypothetical protein